MRERYNFETKDRELLKSAVTLLKKVAAAPCLKAAELVSVAKLLHVFSRLPLVTPGVQVTVSVGSPRREFGEVETWYWWEVATEGHTLSISSGGHFYQPGTGGDNFITMSWTAVPGEAPELADYIAGLWMVPDVRTFADGVAEIDFSSGGHSIEVTDVDNRFLNDTEADDGERVDLETCDQTAGQRDEEVEGDEIVQRAWAVVAVDAADERVAALIDPLQVETHEPLYAHGVQRCDFCRCGLSQRGLFVDGRLRGQLMSGNMCAKCFNAKGEGIGWGSGQLYARQPDGRWRMVAGWR